MPLVSLTNLRIGSDKGNKSVFEPEKNSVGSLKYVASKMDSSITVKF